MAAYAPLVGIITNIDYQTGNFARSGAGCTLMFTIQAEAPEQGQVNVILPSNAYVLNLHPFQVGDRATFFYNANAPMPLIFPPQYTAIAAANTSHGMTAVLETFNRNLVNSDNSLRLTPQWNTPVTLPNGQAFTDVVSGHLILATYTASTRSIPAQATPEQMVVFCTQSASAT